MKNLKQWSVYLLSGLVILALEIFIIVGLITSIIDSNGSDISFYSIAFALTTVILILYTRFTIGLVRDAKKLSEKLKDKEKFL